MSDVDELRHLAQRVRGLATDAHGAAAAMRDAQGVEFVGDAATRYRADLRRHAHDADSAAKELEDAARALLHHAQEVEHRKQQIARIEHFFGGLLKDAEHTVAKVANGAVDLADDAVDTARQGASRVLDLARKVPPSGHPDWLDFGRRLLP
jgi:uncharacterized protein YukE